MAKQSGPGSYGHPNVVSVVAVATHPLLASTGCWADPGDTAGTRYSPQGASSQKGQQCKPRPPQPSMEGHNKISEEELAKELLETVEHHLDLEEGFQIAVSLGYDKKRTISFCRCQASCQSVKEVSQKPIIPGDKKMPDSFSSHY